MTDKYLVYCCDEPGSEHPRASVLADHLQHIEMTIDRILLAAALKNDAGDATGSIMIVEAANCLDAEQFVQSDPFFTAGVWKSLHVHRLGRALGDWVDGS